MALGRPRAPGTDAERAEARRAKVRQNVQNFRKRQKEKELQQAGQSRSPATSTRTSRSSSVKPAPSQAVSEADDLAGTVSKVDARHLDDGPWNIDLPMKIELSGAYQEAFISALQYRYVRADSTPHNGEHEDEPNIRVAICCPTWLSSPGLKLGAPTTEMLSDALLASALNIISKETGDPEMAMHSVRVHTRALNKLRTVFDQFTAGEAGIDPSMLSLAALICAMSELLANKSWENFAMHLQGVGALIEHCGPEALSAPAARDHFYGYRAIQAAFCFSHCMESFLCRPEWIDFPWKQDYALARHPIHTMLDVALLVPPETKEHERSSLRAPSDLRDRLHRLRKIALHLDRWELDMDLSYGEYTMRPARWEGLHDESLEFSNLAVASAFTFYTGVRIQLLSLIRQVADELALYEESALAASQAAIKEALKWARLSCQCYDFFHGGNRKIVGKLICLFPFDTAWETFVRLHQEGIDDFSRELAWCQSVAERFTSMGLPVFRWR